MAGCTIAGNTLVNEDGRGKRCCYVADGTILAGRYMVYRAVLSGGELPVMAAFATTANTLVVKDRG